MMRHPAVHIALIVFIALVLTLVARGCDGDHESQLPDDQGVTEPPLPAPLEPAEPVTAPTATAARETKASGKVNPCLKQTPASATPSSPPADESGARSPVAPASEPSAPPPDSARGALPPAESVSVMPYAKGNRPCIKGPPPGRDAPAAVARSPAPREAAPHPSSSGESVRVLPHAEDTATRPCIKAPPGGAATAQRAEAGSPGTPSAGHVVPDAETPQAQEAEGARATGGGPRLASSLDDGPPMTQRIMRRGGEPAAPPPSSTARLATSMDDGTPDHHERQHEAGLEHGHDDTPAAPQAGGTSATGDHARHVEKMKAGRHADLSHLRMDPPGYPAPEKYHAGRDLYEAHCQSCHGDRGTGTDHAPPLLHPYYNPNDHGDDYFYNAVAHGAQQHLWDYGNMPALPHVGREQVSEIISYVRWLQRQANIY